MKINRTAKKALGLTTLIGGLFLITTAAQARSCGPDHCPPGKGEKKEQTAAACDKECATACGTACATECATACATTCETMAGQECSLPRSVSASERPERIALVFRADWCGHCEILAPKIAAARSQVNTPDTLFVVFDLTDENARAQSALLADALGLGKVFRQHGDKPGHALIIDGASEEVLATIQSSHTVEAVVAALAPQS